MIATIVCEHAHPEGEALLTGGTIARLSAEGHRVVLVVATDGSLGLPESVSQHPSRLDELNASAGSGRTRWMESRVPEGGPPAGVVGGRRAVWEEKYQRFTTILPSRPCDSSSGPAEKISSLVLAALPLPNRRPHRPSMAIGTPLGRVSWPRCLPVTGL